jgi:hypothetical protein
MGLKFWSKKSFKRSFLNQLFATAWILFFFAPQGSSAEVAPQCAPEHEEVSSDSPNGKSLWCEKDQKKNGNFVSLFPSGKTRVETRYENDQREGPYKEYSESGVLLIEGSYHAGKMNGTWTRRRPDETILDRGEWNLDAPTGFWRRFDESENLREEGHFDSGTPICKWNLYDGAGGVEQKDYESSRGECERLSPTPRFRYMRKNLNPLRFTLDGTLIDQESGGFSSTLFFGIVPQGRISQRFDWIAPVSFGFLRTRTPGQSLSLMFDVSGGIRYWVPGLEWLNLEASLGVQTWVNSGTSFTHALAFGIDPGLKGMLFKFQSKQLENPDNRSNEISIGIEFGLDPITRLFKGSSS